MINFSTNECPHCGKALNRCVCDVILQRVDLLSNYRQSLEAENAHLKELLREGIGPFANLSERLSWEHKVEQVLREET